MSRLVAGLLGLALMCWGNSVWGDTVLRSYDPGATYGGHAWGNERLASKMTMPSSSGPFVLKTFGIYISYTQADTTPIDVSLWVDSGCEPGSLLHSQAESDVDPGWNYFDISPSGIQLNSGETICVGYTTSDTYSMDIGPAWLQKPAIGVSYEANPFYPDYQADPWEHFTVGGDPADWMITLTLVPEPSTPILLCIGVACLLVGIRRLRKPAG